MHNIAVIDVETTGLNPYRNDRIVEIATVLLRPDGSSSHSEFVTLVNPGRDMGPTSIHGLTAADVLAAPRFEDIAGLLCDFLRGTSVLAGHNVHFDLSFLETEFARLGINLPKCHYLCTMRLAGGGNLQHCCCQYDVALQGELHSALHDARAATKLLSKLLEIKPGLSAKLSGMAPIPWPSLPKSEVQTITRAESRKRQAQEPFYLRKLASLVGAADQPTDASLLSYMALLDHVLESGRVDEAEGALLVDWATHSELSGVIVGRIHREYIAKLAKAALDHGAISNSQRRELESFAHLLGVGQSFLEQALTITKRKMPDKRMEEKPRPTAATSAELRGKSVCFTGESQCTLEGMQISREMAERLAEERGLVVAETVTKQLDILVVADPYTESGKAKIARKYGTRIMHEPVFWQAIGVMVD
ncbi:MAG: exonuclease domain-containing protein [Candidatus Brocadiia bacterium]|jgi:DNA polymerase-3 subunit epsilon